MQLAHFLGSLVLLGTGGLLLLAAGVVVYGLTAGRKQLALLAAGAGGALAGLYGVALLAWPFFAPTRVLPAGTEISFCGLDCHLHVSVRGAAPLPTAQGTDDGEYLVRIYLRSNAVRAPEYPSLLRFRLVDADGVERAPFPRADGMDEPLIAGQSREVELRFPFARTPIRPRLRVTWATWPDYLILGPASTLVRRKTLLALPAEASS